MKPLFFLILDIDAVRGHLLCSLADPCPLNPLAIALDLFSKLSLELECPLLVLNHDIAQVLHL